MKSNKYAISVTRTKLIKTSKMTQAEYFFPHTGATTNQVQYNGVYL